MTATVRLLDDLRSACATVAARADSVRIRSDAIPRFAAALPSAVGPADPDCHVVDDSRENLAAFWITLDAINFGSGWFPTMRKRPGQSGYFTIAMGLRDRFERSGAWPADELVQITTQEMADTLGQDSDHELMGLFARSLNDLGRHLADAHGGSFAAVVDSAHGSAPALVDRLSGWDCFADCSDYQGIEVRFLKRAQIVAADLHRAGVAHFTDLDRLTMFADNLVPHVLRLDGVLEFDPALVERIEREELITHGSPEEIEIRACAVQAVELIVAARGDLTAAEVDELLWRRGGEAQYKARPRHRSRCTAY